MRFARRGASVSDLTADQLRTQAISLHDRLGVRRVKEVPGLLRELAAEVGEHSLPVLIEALRSEGIDSRDAKLVFEHLNQLPGAPIGVPRQLATTVNRYRRRSPLSPCPAFAVFSTSACGPSTASDPRRRSP